MSNLQLVLEDPKFAEVPWPIKILVKEMVACALRDAKFEALAEDDECYIHEHTREEIRVAILFNLDKIVKAVGSEEFHVSTFTNVVADFFNLTSRDLRPYPESRQRKSRSPRTMFSKKVQEVLRSEHWNENPCLRVGTGRYVFKPEVLGKDKL